MRSLPAAGRLGPIFAGLAGLAWFWAELAPQRYGFEDTDNPATGLQFVAAHPEAWRQAGFALAILGISMIVPVLAMRDRLAAAAPAKPNRSEIGLRTVSAVGFIAAATLLGMGAVRLSGGPLVYVAGLDRAWGETAYLVTQFVGVQLLLVGGLAMLALWIVGIAWIGIRRGAVPRFVAALAILPGVRLLAIPGVPSILPEGMWLVTMAALPAAFIWLVVLGVRQPSPRDATSLALRPASL